MTSRTPDCYNPDMNTTALVIAILVILIAVPVLLNYVVTEYRHTQSKLNK